LDISTADADAVADSVGDLPLAVDQAAALLAESGLTPEDYQRELAAHSGHVLAHGRDDSAARLWAVSFDRLDADDPAAAALLTLLAWLAPDPVPRSLITDHAAVLPEPLAAAAADPLAFTDFVKTLRRRGLIQATRADLTLHRVPAALLRERTADDDWSSVVIRLLHAAMPADPWNNPPVWPQWRPLLPHLVVALGRDLDNVLHEATALLRRTGDYLQNRGELHAARDLFEDSYALNRTRLDPDDPTLLNVANDLSIVLSVLGEYTRAHALADDIYVRRSRLLGDDHPGTLAAAHNLAARLADLGEHERARALTEDTITRYRRLLGDDDPETLDTASDLANRLADVGEHEAARALAADTLTRYRRVLGDDHPGTRRAARTLERLDDAE
jgi:hypothetical protein